MIHVDNFINALPIALKGMLGIFVVVGIIMLTVIILNFFARPSK